MKFKFQRDFFMIEKIYDLFIKSTGISTDSRTVKPNNLFFSLSGPNFNGNEFADKAIENGALYAIIDDEKFKKNDQYILVDNCLFCLQELAKFHRRKFIAEVIAITGSNGKTTTKELVHTVMSSYFKTQSTIGNLNNHIGVPLTLLSIESTTEFAIIEMGANKPGDIKELVDIAEPNFGLITNVGKAHLDGFGSFEGVIKTKSELYDFLKKKLGTLFLNADDEILVKQASHLPAFTYGKSENANIKGQIEKSEQFLKLSWQIPTENRIETIQTQLVGDYNFPNVMCAIAVGVYFGVPFDLIKQSIEAYIPTNNRSQIIKTDNNSIILDAYNANPSSMEAALRNFERQNTKQKVVILGKMNELGSYSTAEHQRIQNLINECHFERAILIGDHYQANGQDIILENTEKLKEWLKKNPLINKNILIKGSRSNKLEEIISLL